MYAPTEGTTRYIDRFPKYREAAFYRTILGLVGMGRRAHVLENLGVAPVPPATREQYLRLYQ